MTTEQGIGHGPDGAAAQVQLAQAWQLQHPGRPALDTRMAEVKGLQPGHGADIQNRDAITLQVQALQPGQPAQTGLQRRGDGQFVMGQIQAGQLVHVTQGQWQRVQAVATQVQLAHVLKRNQEAVQQLHPKAQFAQVEAVDMGKGRLARQHWQITYRVTRQIQRLHTGCGSPGRPGYGLFQPQPRLYATTPATQKPFSRLTAKQRVCADRFTLDPGIDALSKGLVLRLQTIDPLQQLGHSPLALAQTGHK